jgi:hypothetical protein
MRTRLAVALIAAALAAPVLAQPAPAPGADYEKFREQMWTRMQKAQEQMDKIRATTDPKEREKLLREHYETMQQGMGTMRGYGPMMGGRGYGPGAGPGRGPGGGGMMGRGFGRGPYVASECTKIQDPVARRDCLLEDRMDIMQDMMNQMLERQRPR